MEWSSAHNVTYHPLACINSIDRGSLQTNNQMAARRLRSNPRIHSCPAIHSFTPFIQLDTTTGCCNAYVIHTLGNTAYAWIITRNNIHLTYPHGRKGRMIRLEVIISCFSAIAPIQVIHETARQRIHSSAFPIICSWDLNVHKRCRQIDQSFLHYNYKTIWFGYLKE